MKSLFKLFSFSLAVLFMMPALVLASPMDPTMSSVDPILVASASGGVPGVVFTVIPRDVTGASDPGTVVTIHLATESAGSGVAAGVIPYDVQQAPTTVDCATSSLTQIVGSTGIVTFHVLLGGAENNATIVVAGGGIPLKLIKVRSMDIDASGATGLNDFNLFRLNFLGNPAAQETDFDLDGVTGLGDFNLFRIDFLSGASGVPCT